MITTDTIMSCLRAAADGMKEAALEGLEGSVRFYEGKFLAYMGLLRREHIYVGYRVKYLESGLFYCVIDESLERVRHDAELRYL